MDNRVYPLSIAQNSIVQLVAQDLKSIGYHGPLCLTGSRFFGGVTDFSDWDFFVDKGYFEETLTAYNRYQCFEKMEKAGFSLKQDTRIYTDNLTWEVFTKTYQRDRIQIQVDLQIVCDAYVKWEAQTRLATKLPRALGGMKGLEKTQRNVIWSEAIDKVYKDLDQGLVLSSFL